MFWYDYLVSLVACLFTGGALQDSLANGYSPPPMTVIILAVSLGVTYVALYAHQMAPTTFVFSPVFAFAQWKAFKQPFSGTKHESFTGSLCDPQEVPQDEESLSNPPRSVDMPDTPTTEKAPQPSICDNAERGRSS